MKPLMLIVALSSLFGLCAFSQTTEGLEELRTGSLAGVVMDGLAQPVESALVCITGTDIPSVYTNKDGSYLIKDLWPQMYELVFVKDRFEQMNAFVEIESHTRSILDVKMTPVAYSAGLIKGRVADYKSDEGLAGEISIEAVGKATTCDTSGYFLLLDLEPNVYRVKTIAPSYATGVMDVAVYPGKITDVVVRLVKRGMVISFQGIEFEFNRSEILEVSYPLLDEAAAILTNNPEVSVEIQGHTDDVGTDEYNMKLSQQRAESVREYLVVTHEIEPERLIAVGFGERQPVADNSTEDGRAKNRRVDFVILE